MAGSPQRVAKLIQKRSSSYLLGPSGVWSTLLFRGIRVVVGERWDEGRGYEEGVDVSEVVTPCLLRLRPSSRGRPGTP